MRYLIDTCVWIEHLRVGVAELVELLNQRKVLTHSSVIGELACGPLPKRIQFLEDLLLLPKATEASLPETLQYVEAQKLYGKGLGWTDIQLVVSAKLSDARVFTFDRRLNRIA